MGLVSGLRSRLGRSGVDRCLDRCVGGLSRMDEIELRASVVGRGGGRGRCMSGMGR